MKILLTNDDGISSSGLSVIEEVLSQNHEVVVVAPDSERSGYSNSLTLSKKLIIERLDNNHYKCSGTPADCVHRTLLGAIPFSPDIIVSGINRGPNLGTDLIYSGTAAAARQSALMGIPGIAVSSASFTEPFHYETAAEFVSANLEYFKNCWEKNCFFNINVPGKAMGSEEYDVAVTRPARRRYHESIMKNEIEGSNIIEVTLEISDIEHFDDIETDCDAVFEGKISVTPVYLHPVPDLDSCLFTVVKFGESNG
jgi:5'-nucleotidase